MTSGVARKEVEERGKCYAHNATMGKLMLTMY